MDGSQLLVRSALLVACVLFEMLVLPYVWIAEVASEASRSFTVLSHASFSPREDVVSAWAASKRLTQPLEAIWGGPIRHYYSILMRKDPGTGGWQWHQVGSCPERLRVPAS